MKESHGVEIHIEGKVSSQQRAKSICRSEISIVSDNSYGYFVVAFL